MVDVIILCAGESSRFAGRRPKWLLTHPNGKPFFERCVEGLHGHEKIWIVVLGEHLKQYGISAMELVNNYGVSVCTLDKRTNSQAETAAKSLEMICPKGAFFFKDCDSYFVHEFSRVLPANHIVTSRVLNEAPRDFGSKCFVDSDNIGKITNLVEKRIISNEFAIGGYGFDAVETFRAAYKSCPVGSGEIFISHVVMAAMMQGVSFFSKEGASYEDYGTPAAFKDEMRKYGTIFVDLDGTLISSTGGLGTNIWGTGTAIEENIAPLRRLAETGRYQVIITTARPETIRVETLRELRAKKIPCDQLVMGLLHAPRLIINDRGPGAPTMAQSVEVPRDSASLGELLAHLK